MKQNNSPKVTLLFKDGSVLQDVYLRCGKLMLNGETEEEIEIMLNEKDVGNIDFFGKYVQGRLIPEQVISYHIKPCHDEKEAVAELIKETNFYNSTDDLASYILNHKYSIQEMLNKIM